MGSNMNAAFYEYTGWSLKDSTVGFFKIEHVMVQYVQ